jgi:ABC-type branched-subunit amino acid transport system substrate-binding protein
VGGGGGAGLRTALARHDLAIAAEATYKRGTPFTADLRRQVAILRRGDPDAVVCVAAYAACAGFIRDARDAGWDVPITNVSFVGSESLLALLLQHGKAKGKDYTANLINSQCVPSYNRTDLPAVQQYRQLMERYNPMPGPELLEEYYRSPGYSYVSFEGFLNAKLLVHILEEAGKDPDRRRVRLAAEAVRQLDLGIDVPVSFGPGKHQGLDRVYFTTVKDGRFVPLGEEDWKRWAR